MDGDFAAGAIGVVSTNFSGNANLPAFRSEGGSGDRLVGVPSDDDFAGRPEVDRRAVDIACREDFGVGSFD